MDLTNTQIIKEILNKYNLRPTKLRGQHFLISSGALQEIIRAADLTKDDLVLEIGPGLGTLTQELVRRAGQVVAVEKDGRFVKILQEILNDFKNLEIVHGDILQFSPVKLSQRNCRSAILLTREKEYKIVANIPYNTTSDILVKFLGEEPRPSTLVLMIQKEVADRILERDGKSSRLSIFVNYFGKPELVTRVMPGAFYPAPKVDSAVIKITLSEIRSLLEIGSHKEKAFFNFVRVGFSHPRKKLISNLCPKSERDPISNRDWISKKDLIGIFKKLNLDPNARPENLHLKDWIKLFDALKRL